MFPYFVTSRELHCANVTDDMNVPAIQFHGSDPSQMLSMIIEIPQREAGASCALSPKCQILWDIVNQFPATGDDETALNKPVFPVL